MSSGTPTVRVVEDSELTACFDLLQRVGIALKRAGRKQRVATLPFETYEHWQQFGWNFLVESENQLVGIFSLPLVSLVDWPECTPNQPVQCLRTLAIAPEWQKKGYGRFAIQAALNLVNNRPLYLDCVEGVLPAFYASVGFERLATRSIEFKPGMLQSIVLMHYPSRS